MTAVKLYRAKWDQREIVTYKQQQVVVEAFQDVLE